MNTGKNLLIIGGVGLALGAAMPWGVVTSFFGQMSQNGLEGDGIITGGIGVILFLVGLFSKPKPGKRQSILAGIISLFAGYLIFNVILNIGSIADEDGVFIQTGYGLYVSIISALLGAIGGFTRNPEPPTKSENQDNELIQEDKQEEENPNS